LRRRTAVAKVNVSLPDTLLEEVDALARELERSRSGLVQEATARYVAELKADRAARERRERIEAAIQRARLLGRQIPDGPSGVELIRELRDSPPRWELDRPVDEPDTEGGRDDE
jgi:predicted transcriptional regulator